MKTESSQPPSEWMSLLASVSLPVVGALTVLWGVQDNGVLLALGAVSTLVLLGPFLASFASREQGPSKEAQPPTAPTEAAVPPLPVQPHLDQLRARLLSELSRLHLAGRAYLHVGLLLTGCVIACALLVHRFAPPPSGDAWSDTTTQAAFLAGLALIELLSLYFLRLYQRLLGEVRYYQNELTNLAYHRTALELAHSQALSNDVRLAILGPLLATERNRILQAGESTVELQIPSALPSEKAGPIGQLASVARPTSG